MSQAAIHGLLGRFQTTGNVENKLCSRRFHCTNRQDDHFFLSTLHNRTVTATIMRRELIQTADIKHEKEDSLQPSTRILSISTQTSCQSPLLARGLYGLVSPASSRVDEGPVGSVFFEEFRTPWLSTIAGPVRGEG